MSATSGQGDHMINMPISAPNWLVANLAHPPVTIVDNPRIDMLNKCVLLPCSTSQLSIASQSPHMFGFSESTGLVILSPLIKI